MPGLSRIDIVGSNGNDGEIYHHLHKHGHRPKNGSSPTYISWMSMRKRCSYPQSDSYAEYGGRGISVCERWEDFINFLADMGERPEGCTIDRIDSDGDYTPENCRWATSKQQGRNKRNVKPIIFYGEKVFLIDIARKYSIPKTTLYRRHRQGLKDGDLIEKANRNKYRTGEKNSRSKLTVEKVMSIREKAAKGITHRVIAEEVNISQSQVCDIINKRAWSHA